MNSLECIGFMKVVIDRCFRPPSFSQTLISGCAQMKGLAKYMMSLKNYGTPPSSEMQVSEVGKEMGGGSDRSSPIEFHRSLASSVRVTLNMGVEIITKVDSGLGTCG